MQFDLLWLAMRVRASTGTAKQGGQLHRHWCCRAERIRVAALAPAETDLGLSPEQKDTFKEQGVACCCHHGEADQQATFTVAPMQADVGLKCGPCAEQVCIIEHLEAILRRQSALLEHASPISVQPPQTLCHVSVRCCKDWCRLPHARGLCQCRGVR